MLLRNAHHVTDPRNTPNTTTNDRAASLSAFGGINPVPVKMPRKMKIVGGFVRVSASAEPYIANTLSPPAVAARSDGGATNALTPR